MNIEVKIDKNYENPQILILTNQMTSELSVIIDKISNITQETLQTYKDQKLYILGQNEIESIYSENIKVYVRCSNEIYSTKNRLYEIENLLDHNSFIRISNSEIINFDKVKDIDFKIVGTLISYYLLAILLNYYKKFNEKYATSNPYKFVFITIVTFILLILVMLCILGNTNIYSKNIEMLNIIIVICIYALAGLIFCIRNSIDKNLVNKFNQKLQERNK